MFENATVLISTRSMFELRLPLDLVPYSVEYNELYSLSQSFNNKCKNQVKKV